MLRDESLTKVFLASILVLVLASACGNRYPQRHVSPLSPLTQPVFEGDTPVPILTYHRFGVVANDGTTVSNSTFQEQLQYLAANGYVVIPLRTLVDYLRGLAPAPPPNSVVITADDGHKSVYSDMLPIVKQYRIPVTLFIYPSAISNASYAMTWEQLSELQKTGLFDVQSHTYWHPNFNTEKRKLLPASYEKLVATQLSRSRQVIETRLRTKADLLAWPFGIVDESLMMKAQEAGYIAGFALGNRQVSTDDPMMALPRYLITDSDKDQAFENILRTEGADPNSTYTGRVTNHLTGEAVEDAFVTIGNNVVRSNHFGNFRIAGPGDVIRVRAAGYLRHDVDLSGLKPGPIDVPLLPFRPKGLYLSFYGIGSTALRNNALKIIDRTELNALVIDVKGDRGMISFPTSIPLAEQVGAQKTITIKDAKNLIASLKDEGIYTIARIVVFKDDPLATSRPDLAVQSASGGVWHDSEGLAWTDPFQREVWDYNIDVAEQAAAAGFDEVQFDYLRFPDNPGLHYSMANTQEHRIEAITGFLRRARQRLIPYNVFLSVDVFGYVCWNLSDTSIGQRLEELSPEVDYLSPMLYPSSFQYGIPGYRNPLANVDAIVNLSLKRAEERNGFTPIRFRPWLQAFRDYAFDGRTFDADEIRQQIDAADRFGSDGWMLWNPHNTYSEAGLNPK